MSRAWRSTWPVGRSVKWSREGDSVTVLKALAINVLMLAVTVGVLYWAAERGDDTESAQAGALLSQPGSPDTAVEDEEPDAAMPMSGKPVSANTGSTPRRPGTFPRDLHSARLED